MQVADVPLRRGPRAVCRPEEHQNLLNQPGDLTARLPLQNQSCISHRVLRRSGRWGGRCSYVSIILALSALRSIASELEIDRYIALPIFKHFTIIGYRVCKKKKMLRRSSSTATACNFIQDSLVWNTLNYINIYYRTIISPINI